MLVLFRAKEDKYLESLANAQEKLLGTETPRNVGATPVVGSKRTARKLSTVEPPAKKASMVKKAEANQKIQTSR